MKREVYTCDRCMTEIGQASDKVAAEQKAVLRAKLVANAMRGCDADLCEPCILDLNRWWYGEPTESWKER